MCGRTACTLAPDELCNACSSYGELGKGKHGKGSGITPIWKNHPGNYKYYPSTNIPPSRFCPILFRDLAASRNEQNPYFIQPMRWGLIPSFFKGDSPSEYKYNTSNCRIEDMETRSSYKPSLNKGQRCVVLCDGFYEWQLTKGKKAKQPYFIHAPQSKGVEIWNRDSWDGSKEDNQSWKGPQLLKMAALYSHWTSLKDEDEEIFSYTVLTKEAEKSFSWLHDRIPVILETQDDVEAWLDSDNLDYKSLLSSFNPDPEIVCYGVSTLVNNSRNQDPSCMVPVYVQEKKMVASASSKLMTSWLKSSSEASEEPALKKPRESPKKEELPGKTPNKANQTGKKKKAATKKANPTRKKQKAATKKANPTRKKQKAATKKANPTRKKQKAATKKPNLSGKKDRSKE